MSILGGMTMSLRTDLAFESAQQISPPKNIKGITKKVSYDRDTDFEITDITIESDSASELLSKPKGRYITIRSDTSLDVFSDSFEKRIDMISQQFKNLSYDPKQILVVGLGNRMITPDAIGPMCADKIFATRHIKELAHEIYTEDLTNVSVIQTGVTGVTGIDSAEQVKAICKSIRPDLVIAVDALACSELSNLGHAIQFCDTGISPGSGVENARKEISTNTLGINCIAVGIPTVVDLTTAASQIYDEKKSSNFNSMMVTPRNIDKLVNNASKYIAYGINKAFQKSLALPDIQSLVN